MTIILLLAASSAICFGSELEDILAEIKTHKSRGMHLNRQLQGDGPTYVRWGRSECPPSSEKVYNGYMAGSHHQQGGSGANNLCLPAQPEWGDFTTNAETMRSHIYGTELELDTNKPLPQHLHNKEVACVVCQTVNRKSILMVPARLTCPVSWNREYNGYLMSSLSYSKDLHRGEFICMDGSPVMVSGSAHNNNQAIVAPVEVRCGSLDCSTYPSNRELTCVVCAK